MSGEDDEDICGYTFDHDIETPDPAWPEQWYCRRCGAKGWDDDATAPKAGQ